LKIYCSTEALLAETENLLATNHSSLRSPLQEVIDLLVRGRHYTWMGIYLPAGRSNQHLLGAGGEPHPAQMASPETKSKILVSIKLAGHELGVLDVESDRENAFGARDRVLVEKVAQLVALFLTGPGRHIVRKARALAMAQS